MPEILDAMKGRGIVKKRNTETGESIEINYIIKSKRIQYR